MANPEHLRLLTQGVRAWNVWRDQRKDIRPDLTGANLEWANLAGAVLTRTNLAGAVLIDANLTGAVLIEADLTQTTLIDATLTGADLTGADLTETILTGVDLTGAYLSQVVLYETILGNTNLTATQGLETCHHHGPSTLDPRTLARSGLLPLAFLRGCGLNDWEIEATKLYQPGLTPTQISDIVYRIYDLRADPLIQFFSCFISYNHTDAVFARSLHDRLQDRGIRCWLDEHQMLPGDDLYTQIDRGIRLWDKVLLCCSTAALISWWVDHEIDLSSMRTRGNAPSMVRRR